MLAPGSYLVISQASDGDTAETPGLQHGYFGLYHAEPW
jgi:hypothetical protein